MKRFFKAISAIMLTAATLFATGCKPEDDPNNNGNNNNSDVSVTTYAPQEITYTSAKCGGDVIVTQGLSLNELGVCWGHEAMPTIEDEHLSTSDWDNPFICTLNGLNPGTVYHVRAYALRGLQYYYGEDKSFTTTTNTDHGFVDLGLPSGILWATCNVGANTPEESGYYFAWGETETKNTYSWNNYKHCYNTSSVLTKYYRSDHLTTLEAIDDAATTIWGQEWRMPTKEEFEELIHNTTKKWTVQNGMCGYLITASNGNTIFLPAAGCMEEERLRDYYAWGDYWTSMVSVPNYVKAERFAFSTTGPQLFVLDRYYGCSIRPVRSTSSK